MTANDSGDLLFSSENPGGLRQLAASDRDETRKGEMPDQEGVAAFARARTRMRWVMFSMPSSRDDDLTEDDIDKAAAESDVFRNNKRPTWTALASPPMMGSFHRPDPALHLKLKRRCCALGMPTLQPEDSCRETRENAYATIMSKGSAPRPRSSRYSMKDKQEGRQSRARNDRTRARPPDWARAGPITAISSQFSHNPRSGGPPRAEPHTPYSPFHCRGERARNS